MIRLIKALIRRIRESKKPESLFYQVYYKGLAGYPLKSA
jgi:hypothetical protein